VLRQHVKAVLVPLLLVFVFVSVVVFLRGFRPEAAGFDQKGSLLLLYHGSRLGLALYILVLCYSAGYRVLELFRAGPGGLFDSARKTFILCFFLGASLYGVVFTVLGFAGLISLEVGLALTVPLLLFSYRPLRALLPDHLGMAIQPDTRASRFFAWFVILVAAGTALVFLVTRVVYIAVPDPNIWEHYLHYYRAVLASGSTQPNEVWHHFYATKAAGLIFLANVLSDFFGAQLVSACFVIVAAVIILDLLLEYTKSTAWTFFGVMLFFTFLYGQMADGATFKHHAVILGYVSFALWGSVWLQRASASQFRALMGVLVVSLAYFGFYQPVAIVLLPAAFLLLVLINALLREKTHGHSFLTLACAVFAGAALVFVTNWVLTGLLEVTPMRWFWAIADQAKVEKVFGTGGVEFFLGVNNDLRREYDWSFNRTWQILRYPVPPAVVYLSLLGVLIVSIRHRARETVANSGRFLALLAAFILPLSAFAQAVQIASVDRMALYSIVLMTLACVVLLKRLVDACVGSRLWHVAPIVIFGKRLVDTNIEVKLWHVVFAVIIIGGMDLAMVQAWKSLGKKQRPIIYQYVSGAMSLKDSMRAMEKVHKTTTGIGVAPMSEFRRMVAAGERILSLTYDAGYSYALPGDGVVSEPTYSFIRNARELLMVPPDEVANQLRERNITYFAINLQSRLFSTVAFTRLFDVREMSRYFSVAYEDGDFFILTWRRDAEGRSLPEYFLTLFELKRIGILHYPFTEHFANLLSSSGHQLVDNVGAFEKVREEFRAHLSRTLTLEIMPQASLETSKALLHRVFEAGIDSVNRAESGRVGSLESQSRLRRILEASTDIQYVRLDEAVRERELKARFLRLFTDALYKEYEAEVGKEIAFLFRYCDERIPFAINYPAGSKCY
jgi:hypothetical protein